MISNKMHHRANDSRSGYVLVLVVMLLFGIMAMAALVIDLGFARLTQRQLQTAVDGASLEGLRGSGTLDFATRQANAEQFVGWTFDDDLDSDNGDDGIAGGAGQFGAGPLVTFSGGMGDPDLVASQELIVDPANPVHKPTVVRQSETTGVFKIDLRRGASDVSDASLVSNGPAVPYLFARGSLINRTLIANGITVRASATASQARVVRVGLPVQNLPGVIPLAYELANWGVSPTSPRSLSTVPTQIGASVALSGSGDDALTGYCVIYTNIGGVDRVIGFGWVAPGIAPSDEGVVAIHNATSRVSEAWNELGVLNVNDRQAVLLANQTFTRPLLAPVSGR